MRWILDHARRSPRGTLAVASLSAFALVAVAVMLLRGHAEAGTYSNPFWTNNSPSQESAVPEVAGLSLLREGDGCVAACQYVAVDVRTGELFWHHCLFKTPGKVEENDFSLTWRSMLSGTSQVGRRMVLSVETTAEKVIVDTQNPNGANGHYVNLRRPTGRIDVFNWSGSAYTAPGGVFDTLATNGSGNYVLTDKWSNSITFDSLGMPATLTDRNGNTDTLTYNSSYQLTGYTDDRGKTYTISRNSGGFISAIADIAGNTWTLGYDSSDNLTTITSPTTPDQSSGITVTLGYDSQNRLSSITDGRGNTLWGFSYSGSTGIVTAVTLDSHNTTFNYASGRTDRTDRNGNVHRHYFTGNQVTKTDMLISSQAKYVTEYRYSGVFLANIVFPRGNRIDFTVDSNGDLTERRHRTTDTGTNSSTDIVHAWAYNTANFMTSYTDPLGNQTSYTRDSAGNVTGVTYPTVTNPVSQSASESTTFNSAGQMTSHTDAEGVVTNYSYFTSGTNIGLLQTIARNPTGLNLTTTIGYDSAGNVTSVTDARGNATTRTFDALRRLTQVQAPSPLSYRTQYHYDANGNLTQTDVENIDKDGNVVSGNQWLTTTRTYTVTNDLATLVEEIDASTTRTTTFTHDNLRNVIRVTKPEGNKEKFDFNERNWLIKVYHGETSAVESTEEYTYDENGNRITWKNGRTKTTTTTFDLFDRRTKETDPLGNYWEWTLDKNGNVTEEARKDSSNAVLLRRTNYHDERNRLWKTSDLFKDPGQTYSDAVTTVERRKTGEVKKTSDPRSKLTTISFDTAGRQNKVTDPMGNEASYTLDANGNATAWSILEKDGSTSIVHSYEATYDVLDRRTEKVEIDRTNSSNRLTTNYYYDSRNNLAFLKNAEGNPVRFTFDGLNRMIKKEGALTLGATINDFSTAQVTQWGFDKNDRMTSHKDDANNTSTWAFDAKDRPTTMTYPDSTTVAYVHDADNNVTQTTDPAGNVIADTFDDADRNTSRSITLATGFVDTTSETRTFDAANRLLTNQDNDYKLEYGYAVIGLSSYLYSETQSYVGGTAYAKTVTKTFDAAGNKVTEGYPSGCSLSLAYSWNDINRLSSISDGTNTLASYTWIGVRPKDTTFQNTAVQKNSYLGFREELGSIQHETNQQVSIVRMDYGYNKVHDRLFERFGASGSSGDAFLYDKIRRLTTAYMGSATPSSPVGAAYTKKIDYNYDDDGNRSSVVTTPYGQSPATVSYSVNSLYEYTSVGGVSQTSDANGNLTDNGTLKFKYSYRNLICEVRLKSDNSLVATYKYDAAGNRVEKAVNGGATERYVLSRAEQTSNGIDCWHVIATFDGSNNWKQNFVYRDEIDGIVMLEQKDVLDFDTDGNTTEITRNFYHGNALGSVMAISDMTQATAVSYRYDPYGKVTIERGGQTQTSDPLGQHWGFTGRCLDEESELAYYRARYYDSFIGRFLQRDPAGLAHSASPFDYCGQAPTVRIDPSGFDSIDTYTSAAKEGAYNAVTVDPWAAAIAGVEASGATKETDKRFGEHVKGRPNAFLHCLWICNTCKQIRDLSPTPTGYWSKDPNQRALARSQHQVNAEASAREIGENHEALNPYSDSEKDLKNNEIGLYCCRSRVSCIECCLQSDWYDDPPPPPPPSDPGTERTSTPGGGAPAVSISPPPRPKWILNKGTFGPGRGLPGGRTRACG